MKKILSFALIMMAAGGCARTPPVPADNYYRLPRPAVKQPAGQPLTDGIILVRRIEGDGLHSERALLYTEDAQGISLRQYSYQLWTDTPPRMVQSQLAEYLRQSDAAPMVVTELDGDPDLVITGSIRRFEREQQKDRIAAHVALELRLDDRRGRPLLLRDYTADLPAADAEIESTVSAIDQGLNRIFAEFLSDAATAVKSNHPAP